MRPQDAEFPAAEVCSSDRAGAGVTHTGQIYCRKWWSAVADVNFTCEMVASLNLCGEIVGCDFMIWDLHLQFDRIPQAPNNELPS